MSNEHKHRDELSGVDTTGHEWDGIRELNNPLPKWWLYTFYVCIAFAVVYWVFFPAWPYISHGVWTHSKGIADYSQRVTVTDELAKVAAGRQATLDEITRTPINQIAGNPKLMEVALAGGKAAFGDNCAPCHGSNAAGSRGFPNLNDDDWIWGGSLAAIQQTITHGIRWEADGETRQNMMPRFLKDSMLPRDQVNDVVEYVLSFSGHADDKAAAQRGAAVFAANCVACHGADAKGNQELGAPNLKDGIWLYGGDKKSILETVSNGRGGVMPAWGTRLSEGTIKELALYVHSLGGGK